MDDLLIIFHTINYFLPIKVHVKLIFLLYEEYKNLFNDLKILLKISTCRLEYY